MPAENQIRLEEELKRAQALLAAEKRSLEMISGGAPLPEILQELCRSIDEQAPNALTTILLMQSDGKQLRTAAGPRMPQAWMAHISPLQIGPQAGSCGTAAFLKKRVITENIATDPLWANYRDEAIRNGIHASWSQPILSRGGDVLGTFAMSFTEPREPSPTDLQLIEDASHIALIAIERYRAEQALRESEERFREMADALPEVIWITALQPAERVMYVSPSFERVWGWKAADLGAHPRLRIETIHPEDRARVTELFTRWIGGEDVPYHNLEYRIVRPDGGVRWIHERGVLTRDETGRPSRASGISTDITERKRSIEEIHRKQELLGLAQKAARAMAFDWYIQQEINYWSPEQEALYGLSPGSFDGRYETWKKLIHPDDWPLVVESLQRAHVSGEIEAEYRVIWPDGSTHWHAANGQMLFDAEGKPFRMVGFTADVTRRKLVEQELRRSERYLAEAQRLTHTGSYAWSAATRELTYWSEEVYRLWGFDPARGLPKFEVFRERIHPEDRAAAESVLEKTVREGVDNEILFRIVFPDGTLKYIQSVGHAVFNTSRDVIEVIGTNMDVTEATLAQQALESAYNEIAALKDQLQKENVALREEIDKSAMFEEIVGSSEPLRDVLSKVSKVAMSDSTVLILGETGTGKELIARAIHKRSNRASRAFIRVNCAAIPQSLIASELFGHEKGAFTGALQRRIGRFESAHGGTIFLDEVGDLPAETQVALLRVLQEQEFERVGSSQCIRVDVRVLAATHRDLKGAVAEGSFREDLFYRLNVFPISVPPLRARKEDIPLLVEYLIERYATKSGKKLRKISRKTMELFQSYAWPGNVRELQNVIERAVVLCEGDTFTVDPTWLPVEKRPKAEVGEPLSAKMARDEREIIEQALAAAKGRIAGPAGAASQLGMPRQTLEYKIKTLGINKDAFKSAAAGKK